MPKFLFIYHGNPEDYAKLPPEGHQQNMKKWEAWIKEGLQKGWLLDPGDALTPEGRVVSPLKVVTDGPFMEAKEVVGGYSIVQTDSFESATVLAKSCPHLLYNGSVEVRAMAGVAAKHARNTICIWFNGGAEEAARFYAKTFPDSSVSSVHRAPGDFPAGKKGDVLTVKFTVLGIPCLGLNGGPAFKQTEAFSFQVATLDQAETDRYWDAIVGNGGQESACGWCKDKWGVSWQITPVVLVEAISDPDPAASKRAFDAMMQMRKIDIAAIEAARRGAVS